MKKLKVMLIFILIIIVFVIAKKFQRIENGFGMVTVSPAFELDGKGKNVDSIAFWETPDSSSTLMFVTAKDNDLLEVWQYPFQGNELPPIEFPSTVNGVVVDQEMDLLYVTESGSKKVNVFSLPDFRPLKEFGQGILGGGETNIEILKHTNGQTYVYVTDDFNVHWFEATFGTYLGKFSPPVSSIETVLADDFYQIILVPEEQGSSGNPGIYAYNPDGTIFEKNDTNRFGNNGEFNSDEEGILLYTFPSSGKEDDGSGFMVISDQKSSQTDFEFFDRQTWKHMGTLRIEGVSNTDGIASTQKALPDYPMGLFVAINDDSTTVGVGWDIIFKETGLMSSAINLLERAVQSETFTVAKVHFEQNATDEDVEVVFEVKGTDEGLAKLTVVSPDDRLVINFMAPDASTLGIRQFRFESPEPKNVESLKSAYPEGQYTFTGITEGGNKLEGKSILNHTLPSTTSFLTPSAEAKDVAVRDVKITWTPVKNVAAYIVYVEQDELDVNITAKLPNSVTTFAVPNDFLIPATEYQLGIGTVTAEGNISFIETNFTTVKQ
jgi:3-phytase